VKSYPIDPEILKLMPKVRQATFWEAVWNILNGVILWWLVGEDE